MNCGYGYTKDSYGYCQAVGWYETTLGCYETTIIQGGWEISVLQPRLCLCNDCPDCLCLARSADCPVCSADGDARKRCNQVLDLKAVTSRHVEAGEGLARRGVAGPGAAWRGVKADEMR
jgi:hypothetical protein